MIGVIAPMSVIGEVTISSPGAGSMAATAVWIAPVRDAQAETCFNADHLAELGDEPLGEAALRAGQGAAEDRFRHGGDLFLTKQTPAGVLVRWQDDVVACRCVGLLSWQSLQIVTQIAVVRVATGLSAAEAQEAEFAQ